jgi:hypothetical protein
MSKLFDLEIVYPSDDVGPYIELNGIIAEIGEPLFDCVAIDVRTEYGILSGYTTHLPKSLPKVGWKAIIRLYNSGGGWYPDDKIVGWTSPEGFSYRCF